MAEFPEIRKVLVTQDMLTEALKSKANASTVQGLSQTITVATDALNTAKTSFATTDQVKTVSDNLVNLSKDYTDQKRVSGTSKQTVTSKMQVLIPHGIPANAVKPGSKRVPKLSWVTEAAAGFRSAIADDTNIIIDYDVALVTETDGWIMQWEL